MSYSPKNLIYRYTVGIGADFADLKTAVDWWNTNGIGDSEILIDGGHHLITDTVHIHSTGGYNLNIRGLDPGVTYLDASGAGMLGKPFFDLVTPCDFRLMTCEGSTLASYGDSAGEDCFNLSTTADMYMEVSDIFINNFYTAINDTIGSDIFLFNFVVDTCQIGVDVNYTTNSPTSPKPSVDIEIGNFVHCPIGINLLKTGADKSGNFYLNNLIFKQNNATNIGVKYTGGAGNYIYGEIAEMLSCTYNGTGELTSGFDFSLASGRDANIRLVGNTGVEDSKPHAKIGVYNGANPVTTTTAGVFYKSAFVNTNFYTTKMTIANNRMTYQSSSEKDGLMWVSGAIAVNQNNRTLDVCVRREVAVTSVVGNGAIATVTTVNSHNMETGQQVQMLGWSSATFNGVKTITNVSSTVFTYTNAVNTTPTGGTCGTLMGLVSIRTTTANQPYPFSLNCYLEDLSQDDYSEIYVASNTGGDAVTLTDVNWLFNTV